MQRGALYCVLGSLCVCWLLWGALREERSFQFVEDDVFFLRPDRQPEEPNVEDEYVQLIRTRTEELAQQVFHELDRLNGTLTCVPRLCNSKISLRETGEKELALASIPGSGNTWLRTMLRVGLRTYTGSMYNDHRLADRGFKGELLHPDSGKTFVVKTHYPFLIESQKKLPWAHGAIHVVRSPFDAGLADCKRRYTGLHTGEMRSKRIWNLCPAYMRKQLPKFEKMLAFWEGETALDREQFSTFSGNIRIHGSSTRSKFHPEAVPVIATMWYEDFHDDLVTSLVYLFSFVKAMFPDEDPGLPAVLESVACVVRNHAETEKVHRKTHGEVTNIFRNRTSGACINRNGQRVCESLASFWNQHKWGSCDGKLQSQRDRKEQTRPQRTLQVMEGEC